MAINNNNNNNQNGKLCIALDFDGVVVDSVGESSLSAWKASEQLWPQIFQTENAIQQKEELMEKMRVVRPVVETGYENMVQLRCLLEGVSSEQMLEEWRQMLPVKMEQWGLERSELVELFGSTRDTWIEEDLPGWLAPNRIYEGVPPPIKKAMEDQEVYIVTTKQARFTEIILQDMAGISFPSDRIFSQTVSGQPKTEVLHMLEERHPNSSGFVFVEDKLSTLEKVMKDDRLQNWKLFLVNWGYNTIKERQSVEGSGNIEVVDVDRFSQILQN
eukprot:TRINITY_DN19771_c1_g1_i1.p1 TRINITY_DN19771_c1_g1~~TRINITY_DN19771_c1_g1_i1.p1  ORF type:complete len:273 (-),score=64.72 TRINITY_DN19771_c1_g1_i1:261-1079(-)